MHSLAKIRAVGASAGPAAGDDVGAYTFCASPSCGNSIGACVYTRFWAGSFVGVLKGEWLGASEAHDQWRSG